MSSFLILSVFSSVLLVVTGVYIFCSYKKAKKYYAKKIKSAKDAVAFLPTVLAAKELVDTANWNGKHNVEWYLKQSTLILDVGLLSLADLPIVSASSVDKTVFCSWDFLCELPQCSKKTREVVMQISNMLNRLYQESHPLRYKLLTIMNEASFILMRLKFAWQLRIKRKKLKRFAEKCTNEESKIGVFSPIVNLDDALPA